MDGCYGSHKAGCKVKAEAVEAWAGNWILPNQGLTKQPHRTRSRGIGGPGGPLRTSDGRVAERLEHGLHSNPIPLGFVNGDPAPTNIRQQLERLWGMGGVRKQFSAVARCKACWTRGKRKVQYVNGRKLCLLHEYLRGEGLLGRVVVIDTSTNKTTWRNSL